ncbi:hypothetical protein BC332_04675 [Capsicum chinense]|nr:hypothetical protein BC332_04675 [Capsicum chinense]
MSRVLHGPWWERQKRGTLVKQNLSTPPGSMLGEKRKVTGVEQKPSTSPGSMLGEAKKRTVVMQKTSTTSGSNQSDAKKGILVKKKLSTPPVNMLEEGKKVNEVYKKPSAPQESVLKDKKEVTMVDQKPPSPPGCMEGGIDEVTVVEQKSSASLVSMLGEGENVTVVEQNLSTPPGSMLVEGKKEVVVNQKPSAPPGSMLGQGKKLNVVDRRPSPKVHSLEPSEIKKKKILLPPKSVHSMKLDCSSDKMPEIEKKMKSSSKIIGEDKKEVLKPADSALGEYTSSSKKLLHIAEAKTVGKNQKKTLRKGKTGVSNDNNSSAVKLKFRRGKKVDLQQETSSPRRLTFRWGRHVGESQDNNIRKREGDDPVHTYSVGVGEGGDHFGPDLRALTPASLEGVSNPRPWHTTVSKLTAEPRPSLSNIRKRIFKKKGVDDDKSNTIPISGKIILRHQDVQEKKDVQGLLNNVIEETTSKLVETGKSKVKALVGAFETVISLHNKPSAVSFLIN